MRGILRKISPFDNPHARIITTPINNVRLNKLQSQAFEIFNKLQKRLKTSENLRMAFFDGNWCAAFLQTIVMETNWEKFLGRRRHNLWFHLDWTDLLRDDNAMHCFCLDAAQNSFRWRDDRSLLPPTRQSHKTSDFASEQDLKKDSPNRRIGWNEKEHHVFCEFKWLRQDLWVFPWKWIAETTMGNSNTFDDDDH